MPGSGRSAPAGRHSTMPLTRNWQSRAWPCRQGPTARSSRGCSTALSIRRSPAPPPYHPRARRRRESLERATARPGVRRCSRQEVEMLGRLTWAAIPLDQPLPLYAMGVVGLVILAVLVLVTVKGWWPYLWREWITSVDHKRIGVMYVILGLVMLLRGYSDAIMMRTQQAIAIGDAQGYLPPDHYDQIFSAHGTIMIFFVAMPLVIGLM